MENKKEKKTNWWSITAFIFSIVALCLSFVRVKDTYDLSDTSYISIIVTLMGVCATFIVCYQIYNGIEMNRRISRMEVLAEKMHNLEYVNCKAEGNLELSKGFSHLIANDSLMAFCCFLNAVFYFLQSDKEKVPQMIENMHNCIDGIKTPIDIPTKRDIRNLCDSIRTLKHYGEYKTSYEEVISRITPKFNNLCQ